MPRRDEAFDVMVCTFGTLAVLTAIGVTPLLVLGADGIGGQPAAWGMFGFLLALPVILGGACRLWGRAS